MSSAQITIQLSYVLIHVNQPRVNICFDGVNLLRVESAQAFHQDLSPPSHACHPVDDESHQQD
jgi:hypothetical protein